VEESSIRAYLGLHEAGGRGSDFFPKSAFTYDAGKDLYICPQGETLRRQGHDYKERSIRYAARPSACNQCPLKSRCTKSKEGRWIRRSFDEEYLTRVRGYGDTGPFRKALRKRQVWVELLFVAEAKNWHGERRFRLRTLERWSTLRHYSSLCRTEYY
jgi:hypothetical protein